MGCGSSKTTKVLTKQESKPRFAPVIFVTGGPGAGEGTQCDKIKVEYGLVHLSAGDLLRDEVKSESEQGKEIEKIMKEGGLVPVEVTLNLLIAKMEKSQGASGFLVDGFPRDIDQAQVFEEKIQKCSFVLFFEVTAEVLVQRLILRGETSGRPDDNEESIKKRLVTFNDKTRPVAEFFEEQNKLHRVDGGRDVNVVFEDVKKIFQQHGLKSVAPAVTEKPAPVVVAPVVVAPAVVADQARFAPVIFVMGGPGAGKGTQCDKIKVEYGLVHLSAGDLLREEVNSESEQGKEIEKIMIEGRLVPVEVTLNLLIAKMEKSKGASGFLVDGFPRDTDQAQVFEEKIQKCSFVLFFEVTAEVLVQRLILRGETSGRPDDNEESIKKRLVTSNDKTRPVAKFFEKQNKLHRVDGGRDVDVVFGDVKKIFQQHGLKSVAPAVTEKPAPVVVAPVVVAPVVADQARFAPVIFVMGGPGAGKGTQCDKIKVEYGLVHLSAGDLLREEVNSESEQGKEIEKIMIEGRLVPVEVTLNLLVAKMEKSQGASGFLVDGFPRDIDQAQVFEEKIQKCSFVLFFEVTAEVLVQRLILRGETSGRPDDNEESIKKRLVTFNNKTRPVAEFFEKQDKLHRVDGGRDVNVVFEDVKKIFEQHGLKSVVPSD